MAAPLVNAGQAAPGSAVPASKPTPSRIPAIILYRCISKSPSFAHCGHEQLMPLRLLDFCDASIRRSGVAAIFSDT
jgi:hypothetical protein